MSTTMPRLKGFRYPREIIAYAVWAYHRFTLSTADVEDLLALLQTFHVAAITLPLDGFRLRVAVRAKSWSLP